MCKHRGKLEYVGYSKIRIQYMGGYQEYVGRHTVRENTWNHVNTLAKTGKYTKPHGITYDVCATIRGDT